jgi:hypothetical protein
MEDWDPNEYQGKSRNNVETSYRILLGCIMIGTILLTWGFIYELIKIIF